MIRHVSFCIGEMLPVSLTYRHARAYSCYHGTLHTSTFLVMFPHDAFTELSKGFPISSDNPIHIRPVQGKLREPYFSIRSHQHGERPDLLQEEGKGFSRNGRGILSRSHKVWGGGELAGG